MTWTDFKEYSSDVQLQIGQRIQKLRIDKKIAAVDLAAVLDIQSNQMSRIENGRANCTVPQLYVISQILGCSVDYLLFGKPNISARLKRTLRMYSTKRKTGIGFSFSMRRMPYSVNEPRRTLLMIAIRIKRSLICCNGSRISREPLFWPQT